MSKLKSFDQFLSERDRADDIQQDVIDMSTPDTKGAEETEKEAEDVQGNGNAEEAKPIEESEEAEEEAEVEESEEEAEEEAKQVSEMLQEVYEACKNEAKVYEDDAHDDHTVESYMIENAALIAALAAKSLTEMKEEYSTEAFEAACNGMIESYTKKMNEMKETESSEDAGAVE
tara:strand:- start:62801 stop:63322 length:522 start_codon:yes stop_codon:yes gene_type:complete